MKYSKIDIRNTVRNLIDYFKMQNEVPSQKEIVEVWSKIKEGVEKKKQRRKERYILVAITSAAAFIGCIWLGIEWYSFNNKSDISVIAAQMSNESIEGEDIRLIVSEKEVHHVKKGATVAYSQEGIVSVDEEKVSKNTTKDLYDQIIVPKGKYTRLVLSDGTQMYVNAGTKVVYPRVFSKKSREIYVEGEVFLNVTPDKRVPFIVQTSGFDVQVLGTAFDINAYSDTSDDAEVVLLHGKVNIKSRSGKELILTPDNKATILSNGLIRKSHVNAEEYILWTKGILSLNNEPLRVILAKLSRYYGVSIHCSEEISQVIMSGKIDLECGIHEALERLSSTGGFTSVKQNNIYILKPLEEIVQ